jgi:hypothetical protein
VKPASNIEKELKEIAPALARLDKVNFYQVSDGYFQDAQLKIIELIDKPVVKEVLPAIFSRIEKKELYTAPAPAYFEAFSDQLMKEIYAEEVAEELSYALPILQDVAKKEAYEVPALYFEKLPDAITRMVSKEVIDHSSQIEEWSSRWGLFMQQVWDVFSRPRYSFAMASIVGVIVCIGLVINNRTISAEDKIFAQMQQVSDADLHHYIAKHGDEFDEHTLLHDINNVEFTHYFDKPEQVTPHIESHISGDKDKDDESTNEDILD